LDAIVELLLETPDPCIRTHSSLDTVNSWVTALVVYLVEALFKGAFELISYLSVSVSMEDSPGLESWLIEHFGLDLTIHFTGALLDVKLVRSSAARCTHDQVSSVVFESRDLSWFI